MTTSEAEAVKPDQQQYSFKAEIKQLLDILVHSLYKEREIFLRELISNASDALTRLQFEMLTDHEIVDPEAELAIHISTKKPEEGEDGDRWLIIKDSGIGLTAEEMRDNLGVIAQSGAREFLQKIKKQNGEGPAANGSMGDVIGQFGVGFYSVFMAAEEVRVISRSYRPEAEAAAWISDGGETYRIEPADKTDRGTEIHIKLRTDAQEFADEWHIRQVIRKHSDFVGYPIYVGEEQANQQQSLWRKRPANVTEEEYKSFYQQMTLDFEPPLSTIHFTSDAPLNIRAMLFIPTKREKTMFAKRTEPGVMLYSKNVLIDEYCSDLLPKWLSFVDGVVDSEDLPLNVSRESVQNTRIMRQLGKTVRKRIMRELDKMAEAEDEAEQEKFAQFWEQYGRFFKEGVATDFEARDEILPRLRFFTSKSEGKLVTLDSYIERMAEEQTDIYYVLGDDLASVANSPHLDPFKARDLEVLYLVDAFDAFMAPALQTYKEKSFKNVDDGSLELPELAEEEGEDTAVDTAPISTESFNQLIERVKEILGERIEDVRASKILRGSPTRLVSPENSPNTAVSRLQRYIDQEYEIPKRILELNDKHPLVANLAQLNETAADDAHQQETVELIVEQMFASALVQEGLHPNPTEMLPRIERLMAMATKPAG